MKKLLNVGCFVFMFLLCCILDGCISSGGVYSVEQGEFSSGGIPCGGPLSYDFTFCNNSKKTVEAFSVVLSLFNGDGEPALSSDFITVDFSERVFPGDCRSFEIDLRPFVSSDWEESGELYMTDYFYANFIRYEDGSVWKDEFGSFGLK